ncbi:MAG: hypothetical protein ACR2GO_00360 [Candidatus Limnocylindria bacterium]
MSGRNRIIVAALILSGLMVGLILVAVAGSTCPIDTDAQPCPDAARNRAIVVALTSVSAGLLVTPFAFLGEVMARRRIVYRGAWSRAARRGILVGLAIAALAGLRLGGVLSVPIAIFVIILAAVLEWFVARREP